MERVSAQCMLFPTPLSNQEFAMYGDLLTPSVTIFEIFDVI